jgi:hypothetical protein
MKEGIFQRKGSTLVPFDAETLEELREFHENQTIRCKLYGVEKDRSYIQLKLYWQCCKLVAANNDDPEWQTKDAVDFQVRVELRFYKRDRIKVIGNQVLFELRSISYKELPHIQACNYFDRALDVMSNKIGVDVKTLTRNAQEQG